MKRLKKHPGSKYSNVCSVVGTSSTQNVKPQVIKHESKTKYFSSEMRQNIVELPEVLNVSYDQTFDEFKPSTAVINQVFQKKQLVKKTDSSLHKHAGVNISKKENDLTQSPIKNKHIFLSTRAKIDQVNSVETDERKKMHIETLRDEISSYKKCLRDGKQNSDYVTGVRDLQIKIKHKHVETLKNSVVQRYTMWNKEDGNI